MKKAILLMMFLVVIISCHKNKTLDINSLQGKWINSNYAQTLKIKHSVVQTGMPEVIGLEVVKDSVIVYTSIEKIEAKIVIKADSFLVVDNARNVLFSFLADIKEDKDSVTFSLTQNTLNFPQIFTHYNGEKNPWIEFVNQINSILMAGKYSLMPSGSEVILSPDGDITGLPSSSFYSICIGGDCLNIPQDSVDIVYISDSIQGYYHSWKYSGDTLLIYTLTSENTANSKSYVPVDVKFKLLRAK